MLACWNRTPYKFRGLGRWRKLAFQSTFVKLRVILLSLLILDSFLVWSPNKNPGGQCHGCCLHQSSSRRRQQLCHSLKNADLILVWEKHPPTIHASSIKSGRWTLPFVSVWTWGNIASIKRAFKPLLQVGHIGSGPAGIQIQQHVIQVCSQVQGHLNLCSGNSADAVGPVQPDLCLLRHYRFSLIYLAGLRRRAFPSVGFYCFLWPRWEIHPSVFVLKPILTETIN